MSRIVSRYLLLPVPSNLAVTFVCLPAVKKQQQKHDTVESTVSHIILVLRATRVWQNMCGSIRAAVEVALSSGTALDIPAEVFCFFWMQKSRFDKSAF
jgi:hypothetical protein